MFSNLVIDEGSPSGLTWKDTAHFSVKGKTSGTKQQSPKYWVTWVNGKLYRNHRIIMSIFLNTPYAPLPIIDHIDGDSFNNSIGNLRFATKSQNSMNQKKSVRNTTGFKGVSEKRGKFRAYISIAGKQLNLGVFTTPEEANIAVTLKRKELHNEFARD